MGDLFGSLSGELGDSDWVRVRKMWGRAPAGIPVAIPRPIFGSMAAGLYDPIRNELRRQPQLQRVNQLRRSMRQKEGYLCEHRRPFAIHSLARRRRLSCQSHMTRWSMRRCRPILTRKVPTGPFTFSHPACGKGRCRRGRLRRRATIGHFTRIGPI